MFDEAPASSASTASAASTASGGQRTRNKYRNKNKLEAATASNNGLKKVESESSASDLEDALGSPNEPTASLIKKVRRKSGLTGFDQELMRIVGQHLHNIGLKTTAEVLMAEAGTQLIHPTASNFKKLVLNGEWSQAVKSKFFMIL